MNSDEKFANDGVWQVTKREVQEKIGSLHFWIGMAGVIVVLAVSAPFKTSDFFNTVQLLAYWGAIAPITYFIAHLIGGPIMIWRHRRHRNWLVSSLLAGLASGPPVALVVYGINRYVVGIIEGGWNDAVYFLTVCTAISVAGMTVHDLVETAILQQATKSKTDNTATRNFLKRLSPENRGDILTLQAQDHYIEVTTTKGSELILMRLSDAARELEQENGKRVHRSWWVARGGIKQIKNGGDRMTLNLTDGRSVPVSRANEKTVRAWIN